MRALILLLVCWSSMVNAEIKVIDDTGYQVIVESVPVRIISLAPHVTETLFHIGAGKKIIGAVKYSNYPEMAKRIKRVGGYKNPDMETIVAMKPDLVVGWQAGNPSSHINKLRSLGIPVYLSEPHKITDIVRNMKVLGKLVGNENKAKKAVDEFRLKYKRLQQNYSGKSKVSLFYEIWNNPLMTINDEHLIGDVIRLCGGENIFGGLDVLTAKVSIESVLERNPVAIVASGMGEERPEWLDEWRKWKYLKAAQKGNLFFIPPSIIQRHSPRILDGAEKLCIHLEKARH